MQTFFAFLLLAVTSMAHAQVPEQILSDLKSSDRNIRREAVSKLHERSFQNNPAVVRPLAELLESESDAIIAARAGRALGAHRHPSAQAVLLELARSPRLIQQEAAAEGLSESKSAQATDALGALLQSSGERVRLIAARGLHNRLQNDRRFDAQLLRLAEADRSSLVRTASADTLGRSGRTDAHELLHQSLRQSPAGQPRIEIAGALGDARYQAALPEIMHLLAGERDHFKQRNLVRALTPLAGPQQASYIQQQMGRSSLDEIARQDLLRLTAKFNLTQARPQVERILATSSSDYTRQEAARTLGDIGTMDSLGVLVATLGEEKASVRSEGMKAIQKILKNVPDQNQLREFRECLGHVGVAEQTGSSSALYHFDVLFFGGMPLLTMSGAQPGQAPERLSAELVKTLQALVARFVSNELA